MDFEEYEYRMLKNLQELEFGDAVLISDYIAEKCIRYRLYIGL